SITSKPSRIWRCEVPSQIARIIASRSQRSTWYSSNVPSPPCISMAHFAVCTASSAVQYLAKWATRRNLPPYQGLLDEGFAEDHAPFGKRQAVCHGALCQGHAPDAVGHTGEVQHLKNEVNSLLSSAQEPGFAVAQLDFSSGHRTGCDFVLDPANEVVELAVGALPRHKI